MDTIVLGYVKNKVLWQFLQLVSSSMQLLSARTTEFYFQMEQKIFLIKIFFAPSIKTSLVVRTDRSYIEEQDYSNQIFLNFLFVKIVKKSKIKLLFQRSAVLAVY